MKNDINARIAREMDSSLRNALNMGRTLDKVFTSLLSTAPAPAAISKADLFAAFASGSSFLDFSVINAVEREDGSNRRYNVTGVNLYGEKMTRFLTVC